MPTNETKQDAQVLPGHVASTVGLGPLPEVVRHADHHYHGEGLAAAVLAYAAKAVAAERERIASLWAGCYTDAEGHGRVDIGASIRAGALVDEA